VVQLLSEVIEVKLRAQFGSSNNQRNLSPDFIQELAIVFQEHIAQKQFSSRMKNQFNFY
jgi:ABC-type transporter MlaC component